MLPDIVVNLPSCQCRYVWKHCVSDFYMSLVIRMPACAELGIIVMDGIGQSHEMHILHAAGIDSISYVVGRKVIAFARDAEDRVVLSVIRFDFTEKLMIMLPEIFQCRLAFCREVIGT